MGCAALLIALIVGQSPEVVAAIALLGLGVPAYALIRWRRAHGPHAHSKWGSGGSLL